MEQVTKRFWRAFDPDASAKAEAVLAGLQSVLISYDLFGLEEAARHSWNEGRYVRIVDAYSWRCRDSTEEKGLATVHWLKREGKILFLSAVLRTMPELSYQASALLGSHHFAFGMPVVPEQFAHLRCASGWSDLVSPIHDMDTIRKGVSAYPGSRPAVGGTAYY